MRRNRMSLFSCLDMIMYNSSEYRERRENDLLIVVRRGQGLVDRALKKLVRTAREVRNFGLPNTVALHLPHGREHLVRLKLRSIGHPIYIRARPTDREVLGEIFLGMKYGHPLLAEKRPKLIIDAGAHIGLSTVFFANRFPDARIFAVEPDEDNFRLLEINTRPYSGVHRIRAALWYRESQLRIANPEATPWSYSIEEAADGKLTGVTIQQLLRSTGAERIDILKVNVEGAEKEIFERSASDWLGEVGLLCIELHDWIKPGCGQAVYSAASRYAFSRYQCADTDILDFGLVTREMGTLDRS